MRWRLPAYRLDQLLRADGAGQLWRGRARPDDSPVQIRRLAGRAAGLGAAELRAERVRQLGEPHLQVGHVLARGEDLVVVEPVADGGTLTDLLARRGRISQGEAVTILAPIATALDAAHRAGVAHGSISSADVDFSLDGRPRLTGLVAAAGRLDVDGPDPLHGRDLPVGATGPAADLQALAVVAFQCLTGSLPEPAGGSGQISPEASAALTAVAPLLAPVVVRALSGWSGSTEQFAASLVGSAEPEPVQLRLPAAAVGRDGWAELGWQWRRPRHRPAASGDRPRPTPRHRRPGRPASLLRQRLAMCAVVLALVAVFAWAGVRWAASDESAAGSAATTLSPVPSSGAAGSVPTTPTTSTNPSPAPSGVATEAPDRLATVADVYDPAEWKTYLSGLYRLRADALMDADVTALQQVFALDSAAYAQAANQISVLVATQRSIRNFRPTVLAVSQVLIGPHEARVTVLDTVPAYTVQSTSGSTTQPGRGQAKVLLVLHPSGGRWLIAAATIEG